MRRLVGAVVLVAALLVAGCDPTPEDVDRERLDIAARGAVAVHRDLENTTERLFALAAEAESSIDAAGTTEEGLFATLDDLRRRHDVDGVTWEGPGAERAWAGRPLEPVPATPLPAWRRSFRSGPLSYHHGPFLRALVLGPVPARGGMLTANVVLEERHPDDGLDRPYAARWLEPLGLEGVVVEPPTSTAPPPEGASPALVHGPSGTPLLRAVALPPGLRAVGDRVRQRQVAYAGLALFVAWAWVTGLALWFARRRIRQPALRLTVAGLVVLAARTLLGTLDVGGRFRFLEPAFRASDFGLEDPLGWLASPGDFALTAAAVLIAATFFGRAVLALAPAVRIGSRVVAVAGGVVGALATSLLWLSAVDVAVAQGQTEFFAVPSLVPTLPAALMLSGLVALTAAAWILTVASLRTVGLGLGTLSLLSRGLVLCAVAGAAAAVALLAASGGSASRFVPFLQLTAAVLAVSPPSEDRPALPGRVLFIGVLATVLLFPLLWIRVGDRRAQALSATLDELLGGEAVSLSTTLLDLETVRFDEHVARALTEARGGPRPEELAFEVWLRSSLAQPGAQGTVSILDPGGRLLDAFTLTPLPADLLPDPARLLTDEEDLVVDIARSDGLSVRCVVGQLRVRDAAGAELGTVVFTVPDATDLVLHGFAPPRPVGGGAVRVATDTSRPQYAIVDRGRVVRSSDASISRVRGSFGPSALAELGPETPQTSWRDDEYDGAALWSWEREAAVAVRTRAAGPPEAVLALARLVVVGVGLAGLLAVAVLLAGIRHFRPRLHHRILLSYFAISFIPLVVLGWASARDARARNDAYLSQRLATDIGRARTDLESLGATVFDRALDQRLVKWASQRRHDVILYRDDAVAATSRAGLVMAELLPSRLPADAYLATVRERREIVRREASFAGRPVWFGYAPVLDGGGRTVATVAVPLLYDIDRAEEQFAVTGSVLLAAYLLTLVLVLVGGIYAARRLSRPIRQLASGTRRVTAGELDVELEATGSDELGELIQAFNTMTRELRKATSRAVRAEREMAWQRMARQVAHEIKNPLTPIRLMIQQMEADVARNPELAQEAIRRTAPVVLRQIEALSRIANDFAHFARMPRRNFEDVDVGAVVQHVVDLYAGGAEEGVIVRAEVPDALPTVRWDAEEIRRVLVNLVGNAVQAMRGEGRVDVRVRADERGSESGVAVEVEDTGAGIEAEDLPHIFEPDFSTKTSGTGLGLAIVRRTLDDMGATIAVESESGRGSVFRMWWPERPTTEE